MRAKFYIATMHKFDKPKAVDLIEEHLISALHVWFSSLRPYFDMEFKYLPGH